MKEAVIGLDETTCAFIDREEEGWGGDGLSEFISRIAECLFGFEPAAVLVAGMAIKGVVAGRKTGFIPGSAPGTVPAV